MKYLLAIGFFCFGWILSRYTIPATIPIREEKTCRLRVTINSEPVIDITMPNDTFSGYQFARPNLESLEEEGYIRMDYLVRCEEKS